MRTAKKLRASSDSYVSDYVYINQDLTREEVKIAYEKRVLRRESRSMREHSAVDHTTNAINPTAESVSSVRPPVGASGVTDQPGARGH